MIQYVIDFLKTCPLLFDCLLTADFLGTEHGGVGVFALGTHPVLERYADGGCLKQFSFRLSFRGTNHELSPTSATRFLEEIGVWLETGGVLPEMNQGCTAQRLEVLKTGAVTDRSYGTNRYDMDCRLIYYSEKGSEG